MTMMCQGLLTYTFSAFALYFSPADLHVQPTQWKPHPELHRLSLRHASLLQVSLSLSIYCTDPLYATGIKKTFSCLIYSFFSF